MAFILKSKKPLCFIYKCAKCLFTNKKESQKEMNHLIFYTATNSILRIQKDPFKIYFKKDAKHVFIPEAEKFAKFHGIKEDTCLIGINCTRKNPKSERVNLILEDIKLFDKIDSVSFFCHGWPKKIQFGFKGKKQAYILGEILKAKGVKQINLYACSCAKSKKGGCFAEWLAESSGVMVYGHATRGHTTFNPHMKMCFWGFDPFIDRRVIRNDFIIKPKTALWPLWRKELKKSETFRFEFPYMETEDICNRLLTGN